MTTFKYIATPAQKVLAALAIFALVLSAIQVPVASAGPEVQYEYRSAVQVKICHADANGFSEGKQEVDAESVLKKSGHGDHDDKGLDDKGDIIAIFDYEYRVKNSEDPWTAATFPGQNLTTDYTAGYTGLQILNNNCDVPTPPAKAVDLSVTKVADDTTPAEGATVVYTITVANAGPDTATDVVVTDTIPAGLTFVSANPAPVDPLANPLTWNIASLAKDASSEIKVTVTVNVDTAGDTITNTATVDAAENDANATNDSATEDVVIETGTTPTTGTIVVDKVTIPADSAQSFSFTTTGTGYTGFSLTDTATPNSQILTAGTYSVTEASVIGWTQTNVACVSSLADTEIPSALELDVNETITCTFTNAEDGVELCIDPKANNVGGQLPCAYDPVPVCAVGDNLLANASFETPEVTGSWDIFSSVANWAISLSDGLEIWRDFMGGASDGHQNVELDGRESTRITQSVTTVPGATYELRFDFSPRPNTGGAENMLNALVDGNVLTSASGDGVSISTNSWTTYTKTFVAGDASTDIAFEDAGTLDTSYGPLLDNAVLCYVSAPVPGCMDPDANNYNPEATIDDKSCDYGDTEPKLCTVTLVSGNDVNEDDRDDNTTVVERVDAQAFIITPNVLWPTVSGADWIWGDETVQNPEQGETQTFERKFGFAGTVTSATLTVSSDDAHTASVNSTEVGSKPTASHVSGQGVYDVKNQIANGNNELSIEVTNIGTGGSWNPAGLSYKLVIEGEVTSDADCSVPYLDGPLYEIYGYVWHDENENDNWDGSDFDEMNEEIESLTEDMEEPLAGWVVTITNGMGTTLSTETDANGYYEFNVPAGTWTITETIEESWSQTFPNSGSHVVTVPEPMMTAAEQAGFFASLMETLVPTAHAVVVPVPAYGPYNFGNVYTAPTTPTDTNGGGGGNGRRVELSDRTPDREVAGDSTTRPQGEVLGESTSIMPAGAPNTGAGGAAATNSLGTIVALIGMALSLVTIRRVHNG